MFYAITSFRGWGIQITNGDCKNLNPNYLLQPYRIEWMNVQELKYTMYKVWKEIMYKVMNKKKNGFCLVLSLLNFLLLFNLMN